MRESHPPTVSTDRLHRLLSAGVPLWLVFAPDDASFRDGHIPGSLAATDAQVLEALSADTPIVIYGEAHDARRARSLAAELASTGRDARWYVGGLHEWASACLPVEGSTGRPRRGAGGPDAAST